MLASVSACINLKEPYPNISYYGLKPDKSLINNTPKINGALVLRNFSIAGEYDTQRMLARESDGKTTVYFYHRWVGNFGDLATDFFKAKISEMNIFSGGADKLSSTSQPDFILEGSILSLDAYNGKNSDDTSYVSLMIQIKFYSRNQELFENKQILSQTYSKKIQRADNSAASIAPAFSKAMSMISDEAIIDIANAASKLNIEK